MKPPVEAPPSPLVGGAGVGGTTVSSGAGVDVAAEEGDVVPVEADLGVAVVLAAVAGAQCPTPLVMSEAPAVASSAAPVAAPPGPDAKQPTDPAADYPIRFERVNKVGDKVEVSSQAVTEARSVATGAGAVPAPSAV